VKTQRTKPGRNRSDQILTVSELAQYLRCNPSTIYRLLKRSEIPAFKLGHDWRFLISDIDRWIRDSGSVRKGPWIR
jgi:excisionase family DNA binding protein